MRIAQVHKLGGGALPLWPPLLATRGPGGESAWHAHHAMHVVVAVDGLVRARVEKGEGWREAAGALTAPDAPHAIDARGARVLLVFLDPESDAGAAMRAALGDRPARMLTRADQASLDPRRLDPLTMMRDAGRSARELAAALGGAMPPPRRVHPMVRKLLRHLQALPPDGDVSLDALAAAVGLSPGRLMHAFTDSIGLPLRPYLLWCKLQRAAAGVAAGLPLAQAAAHAGFSDAAHMSRAFRRMFGVSPSALRPSRAPTS